MWVLGGPAAEATHDDGGCDRPGLFSAHGDGTAWPSLIGRAMMGLVPGRGLPGPAERVPRSKPCSGVSSGRRSGDVDADMDPSRSARGKMPWPSPSCRAEMDRSWGRRRWVRSSWPLTTFQSDACSCDGIGLASGGSCSMVSGALRRLHTHAALGGRGSGRWMVPSAACCVCVSAFGE